MDKTNALQNLLNGTVTEEDIDESQSMQAEAAEKLDKLWMPIDVSEEVNQLKERRAAYITQGDYFIIGNA